MHKQTTYGEHNNRCHAGLRIILGAGSKESNVIVDETNAWINSDINSLDWADWRDWKQIIDQLDRTHLCGPVIERLFAEHVLEHLTWEDAVRALQNTAAVLKLSDTRNQKFMYSTELPSLRIAVPDCGRKIGDDSFDFKSSTSSSMMGDIHDRHHIRFNAVSLCELLELTGFEGFLIEWHYPFTHKKQVNELFDKRPFNWRKTAPVEEIIAGKSVSRVFPWSQEELKGRGSVKRSVRG
jgi:hypothetical protein